MSVRAAPWVATLECDTVWETRAVVPHAGIVIRVLRAPFVQTYVLWGALGLLMVVALRRIWSPSPAFEGEVLDELADELGSVDAAHAFARTFKDLIDARIRRIEEAVAADDTKDVVQAGLSLEVTAATVGAVRLSERSHAVTSAVEARNRRRTRRALRSLRRAAAPTAGALDAVLRDVQVPTSVPTPGVTTRVEA